MSKHTEASIDNDDEILEETFQEIEEGKEDEEESYMTGSQVESEEESEEESDDGSDINIDLTNNDIYKALCTLLEDQDGNNILDYLNIMKDDLHELSKGVKNLSLLKKDVNRIADSLERGVALVGTYLQSSSGSTSSSSSGTDKVKDELHKKVKKSK
jgi:hypothetical protein